jgi:hypothetical protein
MRPGALAIAVLAAACATRAHPYRFASPMLGMAQVPPPPLEAAGSSIEEPPSSPRRELAAERRASTPERHRRGELAHPPVTAEITRELHLLDAPHRQDPEALPPPTRTPLELRGLVGRRDARGRSQGSRPATGLPDPVAAALAWLDELGDYDVARGATTAADVVAWAEREGRLRAPSDPAEPGDLLVFGRTRGDEPVDLVAVVVARDPRGVTEYIYLGGGVVRRGFVDPRRPSLRRDGDGAVVNTFLRHGKRQPPRGTRYLAGELLVHVIAARRP